MNKSKILKISNKYPIKIKQPYKNRNLILVQDYKTRIIKKIKSKQITKCKLLITIKHHQL